MEPIRIIKSKATPLDMANIDTDQIIPKQFLKLIQKTGYGKYLFYDWRFDKNGKLKPNFVLNDPKYQGREILVTRDNFGSGSSREHAVWALEDYGFKAIIAPSFADIFYSNCFKNGILPIKLNASDVEYLIRDADDEEIKIDLAVQEVLVAHKILHFQIDESRKKKLLEGLDDIDITLNMESQIAEYEKKKSTSDHMIFTWKIR
ncbi:MAG: 3-isopropylmalate dehydratase small subunit [Nitrosopumilales archaeon]|jgi:3-isopropylmalate/(R)-2-methylmalate dehydratase small subunit|nr:3-isopropylmalate dehydratase small subunit [Nitrosopumilales archaeon]MRN68248.1 3-isopropylmalate dehydratase small subunit [Nitrosopumilales archaeon]